jgi:hypothetical protein
MTGRHRMGSDLVPVQAPSDASLSDGSPDTTSNEMVDTEAGDIQLG